jgi:hypothetical protein
METPIKNIGDLRMEIYRLKGLEQEQSIALARRFNSPSALFSTIISLFSSHTGPGGEKTGSFFEQDLFGLLSRILLPLTLNKTLFRNSNFVIKALVGVLSQKASHFINEDSIAVVWDKIKSLLHRKDKEETPEHRGVPSFSETY